MRKQFVTTVEEILAKDNRTVLLLGDIGVFGFRNSFEKYPDRVYNIGILEQSTVSMASGLNIAGLIPIVHTIAPFLTERCFEQIKDDFGYQGLGGNLVSVGASYDYAALGCTHHCPADVPILMNIPDIEIVVPGTSEDFDILFKESYANKKLTYFRLSERENKNKIPVSFGKTNVVKKGKKATVIAVGPLLDKVLVATKDLDVTVLYITTIRPFDTETVRKNIAGEKVMICEPYYSGAITENILNASKKPIKIEFIGVPKEFLTKYGTVEEHDEALGFAEKEIYKKVKKMIHE
jgi:transketolase